MCVELLNRYCIPLVLYATEAAYPDKASVKRLDKLVDVAVHKIFKTFDEQITCDITKFVVLRNFLFIYLFISAIHVKNNK